MKEIIDTSNVLTEEVSMGSLDDILQTLREESEQIARKIVNKSELISKRVTSTASESANRIVSESDDVVKKINLDSLSSTNSYDLSSFQKETEETLQNFQKEIHFSRFQRIYDAFNNAPQNDQLFLKSLFLKGILTQDKALLEELIQRVNLIPFHSDLEMLGVLKKNDLNRLSDEILEFTQKVLATEDKKNLLAILMNAFQSIPELSLERYTHTLSMKTKKSLLPMLLEKVNPDISKSIKSQLTDISFDPPLPAFRPSLGDPSFQKTKINIDDYLHLIGDKTDISEFLVLTIGMFTSKKIGDKQFRQELSADYLFCNYEACLGKILKKLNDHEVVNQLKENHVTEIIAKAELLKKYDPKHNNTRRFFETRLAQYINGISHSEFTLHVDQNKKQAKKPRDEELRGDTLKACNKILQFFLGSAGKVDTPRDMEIKISIFANGYKDTSKFTKSETEFIAGISHHSNAHKGRDRMARDATTQIKERKLETDAHLVGADVWNSCGGVLSGYSPVFYDAIREPIRNMLVDSSTVSPEKAESQQWFWNNDRKYSAYVGSISGHTCNIVGMLDKYMKSYAQDPDLQNDINLFLVQVVGVYAKRGFHAMLEVIDILHDPYVQDIFNKYHVHVDLYAFFKENPNSAKLLNYAMHDACRYTQVLVTKEYLKEALKTHSFFANNPKIVAENNIGDEKDKMSSKATTYEF